MSVCSCISTTCVVIVILQIIKTLVPWLYKNLLGPKFFGPKIDVRRMGQWAGKGGFPCHVLHFCV